jgi:hypothetical protein
MGRGGVCQFSRYSGYSREDHVQCERRLLYVSISQQPIERFLTDLNSHPQQARLPRSNQHNLILTLSDPLTPPNTTTRLPTNLISPPHRRTTRIQYLRTHPIRPSIMASISRVPTTTRTYYPPRLSPSNQTRLIRILRPRTRRSILKPRQIRRCSIRNALRRTGQRWTARWISIRQHARQWVWRRSTAPHPPRHV